MSAAPMRTGAPDAQVSVRGAGSDFLTGLACRTLRQVASVGPLRSRLSILMYHRILPEPDALFPDEIDAFRFDQQLGFLKTNYNIISLHEAIDGLRHDRLPPRAACLTFDDGYADNAEVALPLLVKHGVPATVFVSTGFLNGGLMWNDTIIELVRHAPSAIDLSGAGLGAFALDTIAQRRQAIATLLGALKYVPLPQRQEQVDAIAALIPVTLRRDLMMTTTQVRQLHAAGIEIGGHTVNHPILARLPEAAARREIADGKHALEAMIGAPLRLFAYPNGIPGRDYLAEHVEMVAKLGFEGAVSTSWGAARPGSDLFQLPRFTPWDRDRLRFSLRMMRNLARSGATV